MSTDWPVRKVSAEVLGAEMGKKLIVQKLRRRKNSRRKTGHRQVYTRVRIAKIESDQAPAVATGPDEPTE